MLLELSQIAQILAIATISFLLGYLLHGLKHKKEKANYKKSFKAIFENYMALNVSHLHDAANLFNLVTTNSEERNIKSFSTGAAYHFRSLFNSLKKSLLIMSDYDPDELNNKSLYQIIEKEEINLKDLIGMELFQLGNFSQIEVIDTSKGDYAFTHGNFELLSKVFLNLVENALKYSNKRIKIFLEDSSNLYTVKIMSFGESISEKIKLRINNKIYEDLEGHGLSSLIDIMDYHNAEIHISSLQNEGSCVSLEFKKFKPTPITKKTEFKAEKTQTKKSTHEKKLIFACFAVILSSSAFLLYKPRPKVKSISQTETISNIETNLPMIAEAKPEAKIMESLIDQATAELDLDMNL